MGYYIDFENMSIGTYREKLENAYLPPSRMLLKEKLDERFGVFGQMRISTVMELIQLLKDKKKMAELSEMDILSGDYLPVLLREMKSTLPKPKRLTEFSWISQKTTDALAAIGIKNTFQLYDKVRTKADRYQLANAEGINEQELLELTRLTDLSRIKWVGVTYARMLLDLEVDTTKKVSECDPTDLHQRLNSYIREKEVFKGAIGLNDVNILIETAGELPVEIEY